ncbi:hypothetical protein INP57_18150 [Saccharopolyspora sp. HNM0986]|uniref:organomercurial lyase n=1 Tax=Saccharopolyspora galaxeae TaxID=2781241 RepID=UPI00190AD4A5|nr:organomercurial lyase [Saccharopolyspora sp. HNM0986]MBK0868737.1 hypothetical protein [Saccharopolyspora sp. HNM0986]
MTSAHPTQTVAELSQPGGALDLGQGPARLLIRMLRLLAQEDHPIRRDRVLDSIADLGIEHAHAAALLDSWTERDDEGRIVGLGLTHNPTAHQVIIGGARKWTWCAMDTLIFTIVLNAPITVSSTAPESGTVVRLQVSPSGITVADPVEAAVTQRVPARGQSDFSTKTAIWGSFCHHSFFFLNRIEAEHWAAGRDDIATLSIEDGFDAARDMAAALTRYEKDHADE